MKSVITMLMAVVALNFSYAQDGQFPEKVKTEPLLFFELSMPFVIPQQKFDENMNDNGLGFGAAFLVQPKDLPLKFGLNADYIFYDNEKVRVEDQIGGFTRKFDIRTRTNSFLTHAIVRYQPNLDFFIQPFIEANVGFHALTTNTRLSDTNRTDSSNNTEAWNRENFDGGFSYGGIIGLNIRLSEKEGLFLNLQCAYYRRSAGDYYVRNENAVVTDNPLDAFELRRSKVDLLMPKIGISLRIPDCE